ncbi:ATP-dependent Clp protease, ATP-binding subunit [Fimbriiglobus ruber]|uniref:ATP-dependent Clp protease, ATP-binding subunit n=1 Tax=Fimbriiglobus ruber TaxID=1908690 RepID=A0A225DAJ1_9BACT|nr:Clp protease N-terminal domain-containing protein [Fimbriiglobus ruber]OWK34316.1 ATP-dependent Clp protease, ATP-binding subunit [Fimbriiglobus ruber]
MYERFTDRAREVMQLANKAAARFRHEYIGTEHILLGLIEEGGTVATSVLHNLEVSRDKIRAEVERVLQPGGDHNYFNAGRLPHTPRAKKVCEYAVEEARNLNHNYVGTEHLLLGMLREHEGIAAQVLMNAGLTVERVREGIVTILSTANTGTATPKDQPRQVYTWQPVRLVFQNGTFAFENVVGFPPIPVIPGAAPVDPTAQQQIAEARVTIARQQQTIEALQDRCAKQAADLEELGRQAIESGDSTAPGNPALGMEVVSIRRHTPEQPQGTYTQVAGVVGTFRAGDETGLLVVSWSDGPEDANGNPTKVYEFHSLDDTWHKTWADAAATHIKDEQSRHETLKQILYQMGSDQRTISR